jgi:bifunctional DNA-binding transcriptional regulator/antitoxin component of YhaV-PrlF toxin-antitoxin module
VGEDVKLWRRRLFALSGAIGFKTVSTLLPIDFRISVMQYFYMSTTITISPRGTLTLPIALRRKLRLDKNHAVLLAEERSDGIFLHPAVTIPIRDIPAATFKKWVTNDEADAASVKFVKK